MKYFRRACAVFMTGLFCWLPVLQPVSLYAETVVYDAQATGAGENVAGGVLSKRMTLRPKSPQL